MKLLPNSCGVFAVCAHSYLTDAGRESRVISCREKEGMLHVLAFFEFDGRVRAYDQHGTFTLPASVKLSASPIRLARAWAAERGDFKVHCAHPW